VVCFPQVSAKTPAYMPSVVHASCVSCLFHLDLITRKIPGMAGVQIELVIGMKPLSVFTPILLHYYHKENVKWSLYRPGVAQRVSRGIALLFHDRGTRREWVVSSTPRPHFTPGKDPVPILQEAGWAPARVWTGRKSCPHRDSIPDRPARSSVPIPTELPGPIHYYHNI
jgi:hypothetical protein